MFFYYEEDPIEDLVSYIIEVKTDNSGTSASDQFTLPATGTYTVDWGDGTVETRTGSATHTYPSAGTYTIRVSGDLEQITFNNGGDRLKLLDIKQWGDIAWTSMASAYRGCANMTMSATDAPDLSGVTDMTSMFYDASSFNGDIGNWDVSSVKEMYQMFVNAAAFNGDITTWNTSAVINMAEMFFGATVFNQPIGNWDVSNVQAMRYMFYLADSFNQDIGGWDVGNVTSFTAFMAGGGRSLTFNAANLDAIYNGWNSKELQPNQSISFGDAKHTAAGAEGRALLTRTNATVNVTNAVDNGSGLIRITTAANHGLTTGNKVFIKDVVGTAEANGLWTVTVVSPTEIDLDSSTFTDAYVSGGSVITGYGWYIADGGI